MDDKLIEVVLSYPKLKERIEAKPQDRELALKRLKEIAANFSPKVMTTLTKVMDVITKKLYDGLDIETADGINLNDLVQKNCVVFVPNHQSHADYVALNYLVYKIIGRPVFVAGGVNLNFFLIGDLFRKCGCFFIRRTFTADMVYRLTFEGYLYYLLMEGHPIEFFFEGGRSRTGKLLEPKLGLYQMILEAYDALPKAIRRPLKFIPVSIVHENVPEQRTLSKELEGRKKEKESFTQVVKLIKLFYRQFGQVTIRLGKPVYPRISSDYKADSIYVAHECFRAVGNNLAITPSSLLAMIMLDESSGAMKWDDIFSKAQRILEFAKIFKIPVTKQLENELLKESLEHAIDIFMANGKMGVIGRTRFGHVFYFFKEEARKEVLYLKNTIIHHFLVAWLINLGWINIFRGTIKTRKDLKDFYFAQRNFLKIEFYLPPAKEFLRSIKNMVSYSIGRPFLRLDDCLRFSHKDLYELAAKLGMFSRGCTYIYEGYYLTTLAIKNLTSAGKIDFTMDDFLKEFSQVWEIELENGRIINFSESSSALLIKNSFKFLIMENIIENNLSSYKVLSLNRLDQLCLNYAKILREQMIFNWRVL